MPSDPIASSPAAHRRATLREMLAHRMRACEALAVGFWLVVILLLAPACGGNDIDAADGPSAEPAPAVANAEPSRDTVGLDIDAVAIPSAGPAPLVAEETSRPPKPPLPDAPPPPIAGFYAQPSWYRGTRIDEDRPTGPGTYVIITYQHNPAFPRSRAVVDVVFDIPSGMTLTCGWTWQDMLPPEIFDGPDNHPWGNVAICQEPGTGAVLVFEIDGAFEVGRVLPPNLTLMNLYQVSRWFDMITHSLR